MTVYLVRQGWLDPDCSPSTMGIYDNIDKARSAVTKGIEAHQKHHESNWPNGTWRVEKRPADGDVESWRSYIRFGDQDDDMPDDELTDDVWMIETWKVQ